MSNRAIDILECYTSLDYNSHKEFVSKRLNEFICAFDVESESHKLKLIEAVKYKIESNIPTFSHSEAHADTVPRIVEYLDCILSICQRYTPDNDSDIDALLHTMQYLYTSPWIKSLCDKLSSTKYQFSDCTEIHIILFEDADLYAFLESLGIFNAVCTGFKVNISAQNAIKEKLSTRIKKILTNHFFDLSGFSQTKSLLSKLNLTYDIVSMWSENITQLKYLAANINVRNVLINSIHEFAEEPLVSPSSKVQPPKELPSTSVYNLDVSACEKVHHHFYGGEWKEPINKSYIIGARSAFATATREDALLCMKQALHGYNFWKSMSYSARIKCLHRLASNIRNAGNAKLAENILFWTQQLRCSQGAVVEPMDRGYELIITRQAKGVIILFETSIDLLFLRLVIALMAGNAVVVYSHAREDDAITFHNYCMMLHLSGFPTNVVSHLFNCTHEDMVNVHESMKRSFLCFGCESLERYTDEELMYSYNLVYKSCKRVYMPLA